MTRMGRWHVEVVVDRSDVESVEDALMLQGYRWSSGTRWGGDSVERRWFVVSSHDNGGRDDMLHVVGLIRRAVGGWLTFVTYQEGGA